MRLSNNCVSYKHIEFVIYLNIPIFAGGAGLCGGPLLVVLREGAIPFLPRKV